ncbi:hypothetical protein B0T26DRAFT_728425 [Lasiosphaeria miniovina]|uniref:Pentatricopeptide repeat-containing protein n=1 Tax=Lasiosphaeria miniovina TaxID=1954250 RepID=A0AA40A0A2_9PEZI|nr:uncharacterized protein B0T26DRAFT_728425 [Lasiosphaeria miniovina]KAK0706874.1 hypothetical protein B0T26DRAFT_728425 [Lasiosphaeria miniovina]
MKVTSRIDGPICGAFLVLRRPSSTWTISTTTILLSAAPSTSAVTAARSALTPAGRALHPRSYYATHTGKRPSGDDISSAQWSPSSRRRQLTADPLLRTAGLHNGSFFLSPTSRRCETHSAAAAAVKSTNTSTPEQTPSPIPRPALTKEELLALVDPLGEDTGEVDEHLSFHRDPYMRRYSPPNDPIVAHDKHDYEFPSIDDVTYASEVEQAILSDLRFAVLSRLRSRSKADLDTIYEIYQRLPEPRMPYITGRLRHQLLTALGQPEKKNSKSMLRYFAVMADVQEAGFPLTAAEWNGAASYAARYVGATTEVETESALKLWREMEFDGSVKATNVTFNILFDAASKSGNFTLAEMIYKEMEARGHHYNRYHHVSLIHFFGLKLDTTGIRAAFREMVNAGEIIDTVVLNAVLSGLLRAGEEDAADRVYDGMKASAASTLGKGRELPVRTYMNDKSITSALQMFAKMGRRFPQMQPRFQDMALIHPNLQTYRILLNFYCKQGNLAKVAQCVDEMRWFQIPVHGAIFLALFKGYATHGGGFRSATWGEQRLTSVWDALLRCLDSGTPDLEITTWLALWALRAFARCSSRERVMDVYDALKERWRLSHDDEYFMSDFLGRLLEKYC